MNFNLHGLDIYLWTPTTPDLPKEFRTMKLTLISNRGTRIYPPPAPEIDLLDYPRCRFESDTVVSNEDIDALVLHITELGWTWVKCQKLFRNDEGENLYSQPY